MTFYGADDYDADDDDNAYYDDDASEDEMIEVIEMAPMRFLQIDDKKIGQN